jgi:hypothetical protein
MKQLLTALLVLITATTALAQAPKTAAKPKAVPAAKTTQLAKVQKVDTISLVTKMAEKWFKESYVELSFKDPYSYKPAKTSVTTVSKVDELYESLATLNRIIKDLAYDADTSKGMGPYYRKQIVNYNEKLKEKNSQTMQDFYNKMLASAEQDLAKEEIKKAEAAKQLDETLELKKRLENLIANMTEEHKAMIGYYKIYHDCHANNSYGNPVLGRYVFKYKFDTDKFYDVVKWND